MRPLALVGRAALAVLLALPLAILIGWHWLAAGREARRSERLQQRKPRSPE